jgi:quinol monooxygenase YgiN
VSVFSIWESRFPVEAAEEGRQATAAIWHDMLDYDGYLRHVIIEDVDDPGHLFVFSEWESREAADRVRDQYAGHENAARADRLVTEPRRRVVGLPLDE